jgi:hypothetical protein
MPVQQPDGKIHNVEVQLLPNAVVEKKLMLGK